MKDVKTSNTDPVKTHTPQSTLSSSHNKPMSIHQSEGHFPTARRYGSAVLAVVVCLSVHLSVTSQHCTKTATDRITQTTPHGSPGTLVF